MRWKPLPVFFLSVCFAALALLCPRAKALDSPDSVVVVYRINCPDEDKDGMGDSEQIARYYAARRNIKADHLLGIRVDNPDAADPHSPYSAWPWADMYQAEVVPLRNRINSLGRDHILYIVHMFGVPTRVTLPGAKSSVSAEECLGTLFRATEKAPNLTRFYEINPADRYGQVRFSDYRDNLPAAARDNMGFLATRIDGVTVDECKSEIDGALYAEAYQVNGYGYIDTRINTYTDDELKAWIKQARYFSTPDTDKSIALSRLAYRAAKIPVREQPYNLSIGDKNYPDTKYLDGTSALEGLQAVLYAGWYNLAYYNNVWDWLPGSVAIDFDSMSLFNVAGGGGSFGAGALVTGASGSVGVFTEPFSTGHPMPDVFMAYYTKGYTFAEAAWLSTPIKPWVAFAVGDPLMNPYGHGRSPDTSIDVPDVKLRRGEGKIIAHIEMKGRFEVARARMVISGTKDKALLTPPTYKDGRYQRVMDISAPAPTSFPAYAGVVISDPAGNTVRLWLPINV